MVFVKEDPAKPPSNPIKKNPRKTKPKKQDAIAKASMSCMASILLHPSINSTSSVDLLAQTLPKAFSAISTTFILVGGGGEDEEVEGGAREEQEGEEK